MVPLYRVPGSITLLLMACHNIATNNTLHSGNDTHGMLKGQCKCSNEFCQSILFSKLLEKQDRRQIVFWVSISVILPNLLLLIYGRMGDVQSLIPLLIGLKSSEREHLFSFHSFPSGKALGIKICYKSPCTFTFLGLGR